MKNKLKLKETGSFFNYLMGNNESVPVVGQGGTRLMYSDRHAFEVLEVSECGKKVVCDYYRPKRTDDYGMSDCQSYEYKELSGNPFEIVYRHGSWKVKFEKIEFTKEHWDKYVKSGDEGYQKYIKPYQDENHCNNVIVEGVTKLVTSYGKIDVIFGVKRHYYDFSF